MKNIFRKNNKARLQKLCLKHCRQGFTLIETLVAVSIFSISILALLSILTGGVMSTNYAKKKIIAAYLAQEGVEYIRNMRDNFMLYDATNNQTGWNTFKATLVFCTQGNNKECGFNNLVSPIETTVGFIFRCSAVANGCKLYINNGGYDINSSGGESDFTRQIWMTAVGADEVKIYSSVLWTQGSGSRNVTLEEDLYKWIE